jgi:hypothetical protein
VSCTTDEPAPKLRPTSNVGAVAEQVPGDVDSFPKLRFADGLVSLNDRCMVKQRELNPKMPPVYVSGRPVGFC